MDHMACLAALGHTVVATLHQPRTAIWDLLHQARCGLVLPRSLTLLVHNRSSTPLTCTCLSVQSRFHDLWHQLCWWQQS